MFDARFSELSIDPSRSAVQRILILAANPLDSSRLRLDKELREIESVLSRARQRDRFEIRPQYATRPSDIQQACKARMYPRFAIYRSSQLSKSRS